MNDRISFDRQGITMNNFTISDEDNNELVVDGTIATTDYTDYGFELTVNADNFRAINSTKDDNDFYYGTLVLDTRLTIGGSLDTPVVNGSVSVNEGTDLSIVLPQEDPTIADREGVVEFVDETSLRMKEMREIEETVNTSELQGMDVSVNIDINEEAEFTIVVDEGNGDYLNLQGEAQLTASIDPSGNTSLSGRYEFTEGAYEMSFNFIKRRFEIEPGSFIQWNGEPTNATINITAIYETETAPIDLLGNQLANLTQSARNMYKQELPFQTLLKMRGDLLEPELTFDIRLPEGNYSVATEILNSSRAKLEQLRQQPSELNKQVFALLLLNRFIGENPFASEAGGTSAESLARQSVSKILSQQLNDLAGDLIGGVELNFDLESTDDYTTGQREQRTDLNVGLSKSLLND
ncbi:translocation/assembly module TamB [Antarcticibacterium sp. 1MA-6-2]|uniref:translocation/assembly module TamB domain-containing protein n=1 Tax=Antarcticibacterium sp. 1MA-6-2 TaxID=2908210 RepID=UPI001F399BC8|nr:translocation/assembly module TamB domain-containing protein [Antarcticibacterium sp. 1MA-6-2]UJH91357.1 translocation/assembly module TamB [Antarcticibacterium sp. 1MA-6-2]